MINLSGEGYLEKLGSGYGGVWLGVVFCEFKFCIAEATVCHDGNCALLIYPPHVASKKITLELDGG